MRSYRLLPSESQQRPLSRCSLWENGASMPPFGSSPCVPSPIRPVIIVPVPQSYGYPERPRRKSGESKDGLTLRRGRGRASAFDFALKCSAQGDGCVLPGALGWASHFDSSSYVGLRSGSRMANSFAGPHYHLHPNGPAKIHASIQNEASVK